MLGSTNLGNGWGGYVWKLWEPEKSPKGEEGVESRPKDRRSVNYKRVRVRRTLRKHSSRPSRRGGGGGGEKEGGGGGNDW